MFCYQCEQTAKGSGCTVKGVCGKTPEAAGAMDLLIYMTKGISMYAHRARQFGVQDRDVDRFTVEQLFLTMTNVNFDAERHVEAINELVQYRTRIRELYESAAKTHG